MESTVNCVFLFTGAARKIRNARDKAAGIINRRSRSQGPAEQKRSIAISTSEHGPIDYNKFHFYKENSTSNTLSQALSTTATTTTATGVSARNFGAGITSAPTYGVDLISSNQFSTNQAQFDNTNKTAISDISSIDQNQLLHRPSQVSEHHMRAEFLTGIDYFFCVFLDFLCVFGPPENL